MSKEIAYVSCDPGQKGSFCLLVPATKQVAFKSTTEKPMIILQWLHQIQVEYELRVILIEDVHAIFGTSAKSNFVFGYNTGVVNAISMASGASVDRVGPKVWQRTVGVKTKGKAIKKEVGDICDRLYPHVTIRGKRGGLLDGLSDSLLIAHYAYLKYNQIETNK